MLAAQSASAWFVVLVVTAAHTAVAMSNIVLPTIAPKVAESLGVNPVLAGYQVSLTFGLMVVAGAATLGLLLARRVNREAAP